MNHTTETREIRLTRDNQTDLSFAGSLVAEVTTNQSGDLHRWTEFKLFTTEKGRFIAQCLGKSCLPNEGDFSRVEVFEALEDTVPFFRFKGKDTWLTMEMREEIRETYPAYASESMRVG